jgi:dimethylhistidine N-methyltransferase
MHQSNGAARHEIIDKLSKANASISPKYFYDLPGSHLFERITLLPEYYLTRTEQAVMEHHMDAITLAIGNDAVLVDLGAGNCEKARGLFPSLKPRQYVAVDFSTEFLSGILPGLQVAFPGIDMLAVGADLNFGLALPDSVHAEHRVFFYPGSSIGNFDAEDAATLLSNIRRLCAHSGGLLIGIDLIKDHTILETAYNDGLGVTAAFNLNVLTHLNRLIGSDFRLQDWKHRAIYNQAHARIEMYLEAVGDCVISWPGGGRSFSKGERIHTENSYKYQLDDFKTLLTRAGFSEISVWTDDRQWFAVCYASV